MIDSLKFARPYAKAAFEYAQEHHQLNQWSEFLRVMSERLSQPEVMQLLQSPHVKLEQCIQVCLALGKGQLDAAKENFIKILAAKRRIAVLPEIYLLFEQFRAAAEKTLTVQVKSAIPLTEDYCNKLTTLLSAKYNSAIVLDCKVDPSLLGGLLISAGDQVIDGTIRGRLLRLKEAVIG